MIIKIREYFQFGPGWYRQSGVRGLVLQYYFLLRSVLRAKPRLVGCLTRCRHCRIFFLTHPCNAGRQDLGCPFGCQEANRKRRSQQRSVEYYRTPEGKFKKKLQNGKRARVAIQEMGVENGGLDLARREVRLDGPVVDYLGMALSLIEGRPVGRAEIREMLSRFLRQHRLVWGREMGYVWQDENQRAP